MYFQKVTSQLIKYRFEIFLASQIAILFGSLLIPESLRGAFSQMLFYLNVVAGSLFIGTHKQYHVKLIILISFIGGLMVITPWLIGELEIIG